MSLIFLLSFIASAQKSYTIKGHFPQAGNKEIELWGFEALKDSLLSKTMCDAKGKYVLSYSGGYIGTAVLKVKDGASLTVLLNKENFVIDWSDFEDLGSLHFKNSAENTAFSKAMMTYKMSKEILNGLEYLKPLYASSASKQQWINKEIEVQEHVFLGFIDSLPKSSFVAYYLSLGRLVQDMANAANRDPAWIAKNENDFKAIDFADERLLHTGLIKDLISGFYQMLESYGDRDKVNEHANKATDVLLKNTDAHPELKKEIALYLYKKLEERSLFKPAEFLALKMLGDNTCMLDAKSAALYGLYEKMAGGKTAPEIQLSPNNTKGFSTVGEIKNKYKLVVFGASWCGKCQVDIPDLKKYYSQWQDKYDVEIVFVSVDTDPVAYVGFVQDFPWVSSCDFKGWDTKAAMDYGVFLTPTMYLLDTNNVILLKPFNAAHADDWFVTNDSTR
ncbi:TlpA family protein disulfide reductase [Flavobacterium sp. LAR06]|uniref:TlpA family protein disulfide reductase n=1 Tax=Flavobacterium sp. LAR06 TaxID=3064897 RepID=UPI0035C1A5D7